MTHHTDASARQRQKREPGGGIITSYKVSSWLVMRLYGAAFLWFAWIIWSGIWTADGLMNFWPQTLPFEAFYGTLAALGLLLILPFLTPSPLRFPRTVGGGAVKAVLLMLISGLLYVLTIFVLDDGVFRYSTELRSTLPLVIKAVAGMAITGAILVSMAGQLRDGEIRQDAAPKPKMSDKDLRALRRARAGA